jgi:hypothetical protein
VAQLQAYGIGASAPKGWESAIYRRDPEVVSVRSADGLAFTRASAEPTPILHLANFALPAERGDYGGGAVEQMGSGGIFISLLEHDPAEVGTALFAGKPVPWPLRGDDFEPDQMQRPLPGQAGCQRFFVHGGRAFCLYVAIGSYRSRALLVREVNDALATVEIA